MALTALVLAGTRAGGDPLADYAGVSHKALIEVGGRTMIERVVGALAALPAVTRIVVAIDRPELLTGLPGLQWPACGKHDIEGVDAAQDGHRCGRPEWADGKNSHATRPNVAGTAGRAHGGAGPSAWHTDAG